jgi:hypothetical protein
MNSNDYDAIHAGGRALEEAFFAERDRQLIESLQRKLTMEDKERILASAIGISEARLVSAITNIEAGIPINAAMALLPLVVVAWSDGDVSEKEREAIHKAVSELDIALDPTLHQLFTKWLETRPRSQAVAAWKDYVKAISAVLNFEDGNRLERAIMGRADEVAHAAGAILGFGNKLSSAEQACLDDLAGAFGRTA